MAAVLYDSAKKAFLDGGIDLLNDTIKMSLIDTGAVPFSAAHDFWDDVSAGEVGTAQTLGTKDTTAGTFDAANPTFPGVTGNTVEAVIIWKDTGTPATSPLIAFIDNAPEFPITPNGGDITITIDAAGLFSI